MDLTKLRIFLGFYFLHNDDNTVQDLSFIVYVVRWLVKLPNYIFYTDCIMLLTMYNIYMIVLHTISVAKGL